MSVCCDRCVMSGRDVCVGSVTNVVCLSVIQERHRGGLGPPGL